jgi:hypothetical protein
MAVQPVRTISVGSISWRLIFKIIALLLFIVSAWVAYGTAQVEHSAALLPAGLSFWVASEL